jgi:hypothetical protein
MPQQKSTNLWSRFQNLAGWIKVIIYIVVIYLIYSLIASIVRVLQPAFHMLSKLFGPLGGNNPNNTGAPWWAYIAMAWYLGLFSLGKTATQKLIDKIRFENGQTLKDFAEKNNLTEKNLKEEFNKAKETNPKLTEAEFTKSKLTEAYNKQIVRLTAQEDAARAAAAEATARGDARAAADAEARAAEARADRNALEAEAAEVVK